MNRKYILLRRILGISTILLGILIAVLPMFGRAAGVDLEIIKTDYGYSGDNFSATLENGRVGFKLKPWKNESAANLDWYGRKYGEVDSLAYISLSLMNENDEPVYGDFGTLTIQMTNPLLLPGYKTSFCINYYDGNDLISIDPEYDETNNTELTFSIPSAKLGEEVDGKYIGTLFFTDEGYNRIDIWSDSSKTDIIDSQIVYVGGDGVKWPRMEDSQYFETWEGARRGDKTTILQGDELTKACCYISDDWDAWPKYLENVTPTPQPNLTPTPRTDPTPTPITVRISDVQDLRTGDTSDKRGISGTVYGGSIPSTIMIVRDSDGVSIKKIVVQRKGMILKPWNIRFVDSVTKMDITGFNRLKITLPIPATMNLSRGRVLMVGRRRSGKLHVFDTKIVTNNGFNCVEFNTDYISDYEYGMLYIPDDGGDPEKNLVVADEREDQSDADLLKGCVSEGSGERRLHVADSDGVVILRRIVWRAGMSLKPYRIWVTDSEGKDATDFGVLSVTLPLPADMDPDKGEIRIVGSTAENATDDFVPEIFYTVDGKPCVRFATDYISDKEYGIVYTPYTAEPEATATPTPAPTGTPTPTLTPTPYANVTNTPTPTKKPSTPTPTKSDVSIVTPTPADTPTPDEQGGIVSGGGEDDGGGNDGGGNGHPGSGPIVTPKGRSFTENGVNMNYATTGTGSGKISSGGVVKGGSVSNAKDMPKTGMADVPRMLIVIILIAVGSIELITTMPFIKKD